MRRYLPGLLLTLVAIAPFPLSGCDLISKLRGGDDAGTDAAAEAAVVTTDTAPTTTTTDTVAPPPTTTLTPTPTAIPTTTTVKPVTKDGGSDAATVADAGAKPDSAAPIPTPTFTIPSGLFDGGMLRFDAGGWKPPWQK